MESAASMAEANANNPWARAIGSDAFGKGVAGMFNRPTQSSGFNDYINTGNSSGLSPYHQNRLYGNSWE
jgi:hypothetical protein